MTAPRKDESLFQDAGISSNLGTLVLQGGIVKLGSRAVKVALRLAGVVVMARLLQPKDYGIYVMATSFTVFLALFEDLGLLEATVQRREITRREVSTLFWINAAGGLALSLVAVAAAPVVARFYMEPRVLPVALVMGLTFSLAGLSAQHQALLERQLRFREFEVLSVLAQLLGAAAMYSSALLGAGYWSLVLNIMVMRLSLTAMLWISTGWVPGKPGSLSEVRGMLSLGRNLMGYYVVHYLHRNLDNILIGRVWGAHELGFYTKAYGLLKQPLLQIGDPISRIIVPALSRLQEEPDRYREYFRLGAAAMAGIAMPVAAFIFVNAPEIVAVVLGERWLPVAPLFRTLAPAALLGTTQVMWGWLARSLGRTERLFKVGSAVFAVVAVAFVVGLPYGARGVAAAYSVAYCVVALPAMAYAVRGTPVSLADVGWAVWRPLVAAVAASALTLWLKSSFAQPSNALLRCLLDGLVFFAAYAAGWLAVPGGPSLARKVYELVRGKLKGKPA